MNAYNVILLIKKLETDKQHYLETYISENIWKKEIDIMGARVVITSVWEEGVVIREPCFWGGAMFYLLTVVVVAQVFTFKITIDISTDILGTFLHMYFIL